MIVLKLIALIATIYSVARLVQWWNHPYRKLWQKIQSDARNHKVQLPRNLAIDQNLMKLYSRVEQLTTSFPFIKENLSKRVSQMWWNLKANTNFNQWRNEIHQTFLALPQYSEVRSQRIWPQSVESDRHY